MGVDIDMRVNIDEFVGKMRNVAERQVPFATSLAVNWTAKDAQRVVRMQLPDTFTIRSSWVAKGIRFKPGNKRDPSAMIYSKDDYLARQAEGGVKKPIGGNRTVAIPQVGQGTARPTERHRTTRSVWPGRLLAKKTNAKTGKVRRNRYFILDQPGQGRALLFKRRGRGKDSELVLIYVLRGEAKVPQRWPLQDQVEDVVAKRWEANAKKALAQAIATAR